MSQVKRVFYISENYFPNSKAHAIQQIRMAKTFAKLGLKTTFIHPSEFPPPRKHLNLQEYYGFSEDIEEVSLPLMLSEKLKWVKGKMHLSYLFFLPSLLLYFLKHLSELEGETLIYTRSYLSPLVPLLIRRLFKKKIVILVEGHYFWPPLGIRSLFFYLLKKVEGIITVHSKRRDFLIQKKFLPEEKILVEPNAADLSLFDFKKMDKQKAREKLSLPRKKTIICYTGHFYPGKGIDILIDTAKILPDLVFVIVGGDEQDIQKYQKIAHQKRIKNTIFKRFVKPSEVIDFLAASDILVIPHKKEEDEMYQFPLKLFEYMASGKPIIASNIKSINGILKDKKNAILFEPNSPRALAEAINSLLKDAKLARKIAKRALLEAKHYSLENRVKRILTYFFKQ